MTIMRIRGKAARADVVRYLLAKEPEATPALLAVTRAAPSRHTRIWVVRDRATGGDISGTGDISGVLVASRYCFDRWNGTLLLERVEHAAELARTLDRSPVWWLSAPEEAADAVLAHSRRARASVRLWYYSIPPQPPENADGFDQNTDVVLRQAVADDVEQLVDLYSLDELAGGATRHGLKSAVRDRLAHTVVAESAGSIVGALVVPSSGKFDLLDALVVHPNARGKRTGITLIVHASISAVVAGRGICGLRAMTNGMQVSHDDLLAVGDASVWVSNDLRPPIRFRGHGRLRKLVERLQGGVIAPPRAKPSPYSVLPEQQRKLRP